MEKIINALMRKIDFVLIVCVNMANPNGDPLNCGSPRTTYDGYGLLSDVRIKRWIRNRLMDLKKMIFVQSEDACIDGCKTLDDRAAMAGLTEIEDRDKFIAKACETYMDVRTFGQVFGNQKAKLKSVGIRGPVSIQPALSVAPIEVESMQITKSVSGKMKDNGNRGSDTMGTKSFVKHGLYVIKGSINANLAEKTGFTEEDAETIKECLRTLFVNDASAARPEGSMEVLKMYWFDHNCKDGQYSSAQVHRSVSVKLKPDVVNPSSVEDYDIEVTPLEGLKVEEIQGV